MTDAIKYSESIDLTLPSDIVPGSVIPKISVVGEFEFLLLFRSPILIIVSRVKHPKSLLFLTRYYMQ